ncbi:MAG: DUF1656 domain-containing protein [Rhodopila sp.]
MSFSEVNLFGVYVAPLAPLMAGAWLVLFVLRRVADRTGVLAFVWHPSLFVFAIYVTVLSGLVLAVAGLSG